MDPQPALVPGQPEQIYSVDDEVFPAQKARRQAKRMFIFGFLFLPLLWIMNIWLFWPDFRHPQGDPYIKRFTRWSAIGVSITSVLFWPWFFFYVTSGQRIMDTTTFNKLDVTRFDVKGLLGF